MTDMGQDEALISKMLEDISIRESKEPIHTPILEEGDKNASLIDQKTFELVELLDRYEHLMNEKYRLNFVNGFLNISRANFSDGSFYKKFGMDTIDLRVRQATKAVSIGQSIILVDLLQNQKLKEKKRQIKKDDSFGPSISEEKNSERESIGSSDQKESQKFISAIDPKLKAADPPSEHKPDNESVTLKDPIHQFGGLVPFELIQAQIFFSEALKDSVESINLKKKILTLVKEIEQLKSSFKPV